MIDSLETLQVFSVFLSPGPHPQLLHHGSSCTKSAATQLASSMKQSVQSSSPPHLVMVKGGSHEVHGQLHRAHLNFSAPEVLRQKMHCFSCFSCVVCHPETLATDIEKDQQAKKAIDSR